MPLLKAWYLQDEELHVVSCGTHDQLENGNTAPSAAFRGFGKVIMPWAATCVGAAMATSASERIIMIAQLRRSTPVLYKALMLSRPASPRSPAPAESTAPTLPAEVCV